MISMVTKRDGRVVPYDENRVRTAIHIAITTTNCGNDDPEVIVDKILSKVTDRLNTLDDDYTTISVEEIQDIVVDSMKSLNLTKLARSFTSYRNKRTRIREKKSSLMKAMQEMDSSDAKNSNSKRENANINGDTAMGTMLKFGTTASKAYYLTDVIPEKASKAHIDGDIHIHDMDFYSLTTTCTQIDIGKLLDRGFSTGHGHLRTPNGINTGAALTCIAIQSNQNDQHGGQSIPTFDYGLAPYVSKTFITNICEYLDNNEVSEDDIKTIRENLKEYNNTHKSIMCKEALADIEKIIYSVIGTSYVIPSMCIDKALKHTDRDTYQAMEAMVHNLNTMNSRAGAQVPFSSINFGTCTSEEGRMVSKNLMLAQEAGLGAGETPIFPILIFKVCEGVNYNKEDPNYDLFRLACRVSAKRLFPNFSFIDAPFNAMFYKKGNPDTEIAYMGCVKGTETVSVLYGNDILTNITFESLYEKIQNDFVPIKYSEKSDYYVTESHISIYDSASGRYVNCKKFIVNKEVTNWLKLSFSNGQCLVCTTDHPLPIYTQIRGATRQSLKEDSTRTFAQDVRIGSMVAVSDIGLDEVEDRFISVVDIAAVTMCENSYDVETDSDRFDVSGINSHNCRTRVISDVNDPDNQIVTGRGNLSFTSINLPRLAIEAKKDISKFYELLDEKMELCKDQLLHRYKIQCSKTLKNYPFLMGQGVWKGSDELGVDDNLESVLKHGTLSIGFIGLAETLVALTGKHHGESEESQKLGLEIIGHMRDYMDKMTELYSLNFSLLATPAEGLSGRFVKMDKQRYGIIPGVTDRDYYTNSSHVPVYYPISAYKKIQIEAPYQALCNAGHICYVELDGDPSENIEAFESVVRCMKESGIGYGAINHPVDRDPICGYIGIIGDTCPCCGRHEGEALTPEAYRNIIAKNRLGGTPYGS